MMKIKQLFISLLLTAMLFPTSALAVDRMESDSYKLQWTNLNMTSGNQSSNRFNLLDTVGQTAAGEASGSSFIVRAGFPYIKTIIPFGFTISDLSIDFGILAPNSSSTQTNTLTVSAGGAGGYSVVASQNHPLQLQAGTNPIPDTPCNTSCDHLTADVWTDTQKYGFGYNMQGNDIPSSFVDSTYFKQFADDSFSETPQIVMTSSNVGTNRTATVTYKVNISGTQAAGDYENTITFTATPGY